MKEFKSANLWGASFALKDTPSFVAYIFLLALFTGCCPLIFNLIEKHVLGWGDDRVVTMGMLMMIGSVVGFFMGGRAVDKYGTKPVFMVMHFSYGVRDIPVYHAGVRAFGFGIHPDRRVAFPLRFGPGGFIHRHLDRDAVDYSTNEQVALNDDLHDAPGRWRIRSRGFSVRLFSRRGC